MIRLNSLTLGRITTLSSWISPVQIRAMIFMCTVCNAGEASRNSSSCEARNPCDGVADKSNKTRFGQMNRERNGDHRDSEWKRRTFRFTTFVRRDGGSGIPCKSDGVVLIVRAWRRCYGSGSSSDNVWMLSVISRDRSCLVWEDSSLVVLTGTPQLTVTSSGHRFARPRRICT